MSTYHDRTGREISYEEHVANRKQESKEEAEKLARDLGNFVNGGGDQEAFIAAIQREHRTNQQGIFRLIGEIIKAWALAYVDKEYDLRNEVACQKSRSLLLLDTYFFDAPHI